MAYGSNPTTRKYRWLNFHPPETTTAIRQWLANQVETSAVDNLVMPLVLQGNKGSGRNYLLEASCFEHHVQHKPCIVIPIDLEQLEATSFSEQFEHIKTQIDDLEDKLTADNPTLWNNLKGFLDGVSVQAPPISSFGNLAFAITLGSLRYLTQLPSYSTDAEENASAFDEQIEQQLSALQQHYHIILHLRQAELLDTKGLFNKLKRMVRRLNTASADNTSGMITLALSFLDSTPLYSYLGDNKHYQLTHVNQLNKFNLQQALKHTYGQTIATPEFSDILLNHAAFKNGQIDANALAHMLNALLDNDLLLLDEGQWQFSQDFNRESLRALIGRNIEEHWHERVESLTHQLPAFHKQFWALAAMGGEWLPLELLLDYLEYHGDARDDFIDLLDDEFEETNPPLLQCLGWRFAGMGNKLLYQFTSPLLPDAILADYPREERQQYVASYLKWLKKQWIQPNRNQAGYLLRLAEYATNDERTRWREHLAWQVEAEFAHELQRHILYQLETGELSLQTLDQMMWKNYGIWPTPRQRAICNAWLAYYQRQQIDVTLDWDATEEEWSQFWREDVPVDSTIPATKEGLDLCYFIGNNEKSFGNYNTAKQYLELGLQLSLHHSNLDVEARFHRVIAIIKYRQGELDQALNRLKTQALPLFRKTKNQKSIAVCSGQIADILQVRGQLDEALNIREKEELPVYEKLGDVYAKAVTMGKIAHILQTHGQLDEARNIHEKEQLPAYEKLGNVHEIAIIKSQIADILASRNRMQGLWQYVSKKQAIPSIKTREAARKTLDRILPTFESLQDGMQIGRTCCQIADLEQIAGNFENALEFRKKAIAQFEKSGYAHDLVNSRAKLAMLYWQMDAEKYHDEIEHLMHLALYKSQQMKIPEADQLIPIMDTMEVSRSITKDAATTEN